MAIQQGWSQMTAAVQNTIRKGVKSSISRGVRRAGKRVTRSSKKKHRVRARNARAKSSRARGRGNKRRLVKGSLAAKRFMAKIRKLRSGKKKGR